MSLILGGQEITGTARVQIDPAAWWHPGDYGTKHRARGALVTSHGGHWTAGEAGSRRTDDDGRFIFNVMRNRLSNDPVRAAQGIKLKVSIHFVIGAGGDIWQLADPLTTVAIHVGDGRVNDRSIGTEVVNPGTGPMLPERPRETIRLPLLPTPKYPRGKPVKQLAYYDVQLDAWCWLNDILTKHLPIPRHVPGGAGGGYEIDRFTPQEMARWKGVFEHYHVPSTTKRDGGSQLIRALAERTEIHLPASFGVAAESLSRSPYPIVQP